MIRNLFLIFFVFCGPIFAYTPEKVEITANASKVPAKRSQMRIDFTARAIYGFYENVSFYFSSDNIITIEISPSGPITLDENGLSGYGIINLDMQDTLYKVYLIIKSDEEILGSTYFYFRNAQGNALKLTEDQYLRFAEEKKQMWMNSQAEEHAKADLDSLRAKGLKIAVENWPKEGETFIPLENNIGDTLEIMDNSLYEIKLTEKAIQDPLYKDIVKIELQPPDGGPSYYANFTIDPNIAQQQFCVNLLADLKIIAKLFNPHSNKFTYWISNPITARIEYQGYVLNRATGDCEIKMFVKEIPILGQYIQQDDLFEGIGYALVNVPPSGNYTLKGIKFYTYNDTIKAGSCYMRDDPTSGDPDCWKEYPNWIEGSENVYYWQEGSWGSQSMIQNTRCPYGTTIKECQGFTEDPNDPFKLRKYVALVIAKNYAIDDEIRVEKIPLYNDMIEINNFWALAGFEQDYLKYRACPWHNMSPAGDFNHSCTSQPIIRIKDDQSFGVTIYHETGHWLQYKMQNNYLAGEYGNWSNCDETRMSTALQEGFAEWHEDFVSGGGYDDIEHSRSCIEYSSTNKKVAYIFSFLWDLWDSVDDDNADHNCKDYDWDSCGDNVNLDASQLKSWIGHRYTSISEFIHSFKQPGMPLDCTNSDPAKEHNCKCNVCKLQNSHGLLTDDCYDLICN